MADIIDVQTDNNLRYQFYPVSSGSVQFKVRAPNDAHLALTTGPQESDPMYEVFIGGWRNSKSVIRKNRTKPDEVEIETPGILNRDEYRGFWIRWDSGVISAGHEGVPIPFISWVVPEPFPIGFVGVCTGWGATGSWKIEASPVIAKPIVDTQLRDGKLRWREMVDGRLPPDALIGGFENEPVYIARAQHDRCCLCLGKYVPSKNLAYVPCGCREHSKSNFEILCGYNAKWVKTSGNHIPELAFVGSPSENGQPLYVGRALHDGNLLPGKVYVPHKRCYLPYRASPVIAKPIVYKQLRDGKLRWREMVDGRLPPDALIGGFENEPVYIARARHNRSLCPGKYVPSKHLAYVAWGHREHSKSNFEILCGYNAKWVKTRGNHIPEYAFVGGTSEVRGEPLYVGRALHDGKLLPGKVHVLYKTCYLPYKGQEVEVYTYEILVSLELMARGIEAPLEE